MKKYIAVVAMVMLVSCSGQEKAEAPKQTSLESDSAKLSYAIGMDIGRSLKGLSEELDKAALMDAIDGSLDGAKLRLSAKEADKIKRDFFQKRATKQAEERKTATEKNKAEGEKFLAENAKKEGVHVTPSGLQYEVLNMGDGKKPVVTDKVKVHYKGMLLDGTVFDSSYKRGQPISFPLNGVIKGWIEGLQLMPVGSKFKFYIPADLAYGKHGAGAAIAPDSTLIFEVELLGIENQKTAQDTTPATK